MAPHACLFCSSLVIRPIQNAKTAKPTQLFLFNCTLQDLQSSLALDCNFAQFVLKALHQDIERQSSQLVRDSGQGSPTPGELDLFIKAFRPSNSHEIEGIHSIGLLDRRKEDHEEFCSNRSSYSDMDYLVMYATESEFFTSGSTGLFRWAHYL